MTEAQHTFGDRSKISWVTTIAFAIFHVLAVAALFFWDWGAIAVAAALHWICIGWGIGLGYHRLHTHRSYTCPKWFEYFLAVCGTMTLEGGPLFWVATHRIHHKFSDQHGDPHTPRDGKWWAHMLWTIFGESKHADTEMMGKFAPDLYKDPFYRWLTTYHWVPVTVLGLALYAFGGLPYVLWGVFFRVVFGLHATWLVNSATHLWGSRRFHTRDDSKNSWWVALLTFGEGWHNNHHAHPASARHGLVWYELDVTWLTIKLFSLFGFVKDIKLPAQAQLDLMQMTFEERKAA
ncbi:MAG: fatty acid desaturase [Bryobacterales bacterium]